MVYRTVQILLVGVVCISVNSAFPLDTMSLCAEMLHLNCNAHYAPEGDETLCGTNGKTYVNKCFLVQERCKNSSLDKAHDGPCQSSSTSPTILDEVTNIIQIMTFEVKDDFCDTIESVSCPETLDPLCGTNNKFFLNVCHFNVEKCQNRTLQLQPLEICKQ